MPIKIQKHQCEIFSLIIQPRQQKNITQVEFAMISNREKMTVIHIREANIWYFQPCQRHAMALGVAVRTTVLIQTDTSQQLWIAMKSCSRFSFIVIKQYRIAQCNAVVVPLTLHMKKMYKQMFNSEQNKVANKNNKVNKSSTKGRNKIGYTVTYIQYTSSIYTVYPPVLYLVLSSICQPSTLQKPRWRS